MSPPQRTQVAIGGASPAGLLLGQLGHRHGVDSVIVETRSREYCEARIRAGVIEQSARETLIEAGVGDRMQPEGLVHGGIHLRFDEQSHHIPMGELTGGRTVTIYGQTELTKDLVGATHRHRRSLVFDCDHVLVDGLEQDAPSVGGTVDRARRRRLGPDRRARDREVDHADGSFVAAPIRYRKQLLAGDATHIVPPTGAKGLNLAIADIAVLAEALIELQRLRDRTQRVRRTVPAPRVAGSALFVVDDSDAACRSA